MKETNEEMNAPQSNDYHSGSSRSFRFGNSVNRVNPDEVAGQNLPDQQAFGPRF